MLSISVQNHSFFPFKDKNKYCTFLTLLVFLKDLILPSNMHAQKSFREQEASEVHLRTELGPRQPFQIIHAIKLIQTLAEVDNKDI